MYGIKENKKRYNNMCLPKSVNASVISLKRLSRRVKYEIDNHPFPAKRDKLSTTWIFINKSLQRLRQLESDYVAVSKYETSEGRKKYQSHLIAEQKVNSDPHTVYFRKESYFSPRNRGISIAVGDTYKLLPVTENCKLPKLFENNINATYRVIANSYIQKMVSVYTYNVTPVVTVEIIPADRDNTAKREFVTISVKELGDLFYLEDIQFHDEDYTPYYCESCGEWHENWANDGSL